jgi:hypothetical protein
MELSLFVLQGVVKARIMNDTTHNHTSRIKEPLYMFFRRYVIARIYIVLSVLITVCTLLKAPYALGAYIPPFLVVLAFGVCMVAILDIIINDIAPDKYIFHSAYKYRHIVYMLISLISFSISAGAVLDSNGVLSVERLWLDGLVAAVVAVLDIFARHRGHHVFYGRRRYEANI